MMRLFFSVPPSAANSSGQRVERPGVVLGHCPVRCGVGGIEIGKLPRDGTGHLRGHARAGEQVRVHPPMMVPLMLLVRFFRIRIREQPEMPLELSMV